jgi:uroporphyrinogen-III decarboxylase
MEDAKRIAVPDSTLFDQLGWNSMQQQVINRYKDKMDFIADLGSPTMSFHVSMRGIENALFDLILDPPLVHAVMSKGARISIAKGKYWLDHGFTILRLNDSAGTMTLISPAHWKEFVFPYFKEICAELHAYNKRAKIYCHICGNILPICDLLVDSGLDCIGPLDPLGVSVKDVADRVGNSVALMGGVNTLSLLQNTPAGICDEALTCIDSAYPESFILGSGCAVPRNCPQNNLKALKTASSLHSKRT